MPKRGSSPFASSKVWTISFLLLRFGPPWFFLTIRVGWATARATPCDTRRTRRARSTSSASGTRGASGASGTVSSQATAEGQAIKPASRQLFHASFIP